MIRLINKSKVRVEQEISIVREVDVLVVGGGAAGVGAAICAARNGMDTLLVEQQGCLGGLVTLGLVNWVASYPEAVGKELLNRLQAEGALSDRRICDPEKTKYVLEQMVLESGAKIFYWTYVIDAITENSVIKGVIVHNKSGRQAIVAKIVIDCSGDGDVAAYAGAPYEIGGGEKYEGYNQAVSLDFRLGNVDWTRFNAKKYYSTIESLIEKAVELGDLPYLVECGYIGVLPGKPDDRAEVYVCTAHSRRCHTMDAEDLTRIVIEQRRQIQQIFKFFRKYIGGFESCWLIDTATLLGVRDSRRIIGEYVFTAEDLVFARKFPDAITRDTHGFDIHNPTNIPHIKHTHLSEPKEPAVCRPNGKGGYEARFKPGEYYEIPYRCLVPLKIENLLVAGRCISATFEAQSGTRLIMTCMNMGQAAGTAAALAIKNKITPRKLNVSFLRDKLVEQGINLKEEPPLYYGGAPRSRSIPPDAKFEVNSAIGADGLRIVE